MSEQPEVKISVGRDQNGQIVVGGHATLNVGNAGEEPAEQLVQRNTAEDDGEIYAVGRGDLHVHHHHHHHEHEQPEP